MSQDHSKTVVAEPPPDRGPRPLIIRLGLFFGVPIVVVGLGAVVAYEWMRAELGEYRDGLRAAGYAATLGELNARYAGAAPAQTNAKVYERAFAKMNFDAVAGTANDLWIARRRYDWIWQYPDALRERLVECPAKHAQIYEAIHQATDAGPLYTTLDLSPGAQRPLTHLMNLRDMAHLLVIESEGALIRGDLEGAVEAHVRVRTIVDSLRGEPIPLSHQVRLMLADRSVRALERLLSAAALSERAIERLQAAYGWDVTPDAFKRAQANALLVGMDSVNRRAGMPKIVRLAGPLAAPWLHYEQFLMARALVPCVLTNADTWPEMLAVVDGSGRIEAPNRLAGAWVAQQSTVQKAFAHTAAAVRCARVALAVEAYRLEHGRPPDALAEITNAFPNGIPRNPYDGEPLAYRRADQDYGIYAIQIDRGGRGGDPENDYAFEVRRLLRKAPQSNEEEANAR